MNELYKNFKMPTIGQCNIQPKKIEHKKRFLPYAASVAGSSTLGGVLGGDIFKIKTSKPIKVVVKTPKGLEKYFDSIIEKIKNNSKNYTDTEKEVIEKLGMHTFDPIISNHTKIAEVKSLKPILESGNEDVIGTSLFTTKGLSIMNLTEEIKKIMIKYFYEGDGESKAILNNFGIFDDFLTKYIKDDWEVGYRIGCMPSDIATVSAHAACSDSGEFIENYLAKGKSKEEVVSGLKSLTEKFSDTTTMIIEKVVPITKFNKKAAAIGAVIMAIVGAIAAKIVLTKKSSQKSDN